MRLPRELNQYAIFITLIAGAILGLLGHAAPAILLLCCSIICVMNEYAAEFSVHIKNIESILQKMSDDKSPENKEKKS